MAIDIVRRTDAVHLPEHDLESFFWVLVWIVLQHTDHDDSEGDKACGHLFVDDNDRRSYWAKLGWLADDDMCLGVRDNAPLTRLLQRFKDLIRHRYNLNAPAVPLTHDTVLTIIDEALAMEGWPTDDKARTVVTDAFRGSNRPHTSSKAQVPAPKRRRLDI